MVNWIGLSFGVPESREISPGDLKLEEQARGEVARSRRGRHLVFLVQTKSVGAAARPVGCMDRNLLAEPIMSNKLPLLEGTKRRKWAPGTPQSCLRYCLGRLQVAGLWRFGSPSLRKLKNITQPTLPVKFQLP
jgi:hypothetical protein